MATKEKLFVIYDYRAAHGDSDAANVFCCADSIEEARGDIRDMFGSGCIYEYDIVRHPRPKRDELINERLVESIGVTK